MSVLSDVSSSLDLQPTSELGPTTIFHTSTMSAVPTADTAGSDSSSAMESSHSHIQCLLPNDLTAEQRARTEAIIKSRANVFSGSEYDIGRTKIILHRIDTGENQPHFEQLRRHAMTQLLLIDKHVERMLKDNVIEPAASPWCSNVVMVHKQDGIMMFCVDYRKVNELIKKDKFPLLKIDTCLDWEVGNKDLENIASERYENRHLRRPLSCLMPHVSRTPANICKTLYR